MKESDYVAAGHIKTLTAMINVAQDVTPSLLPAESRQRYRDALASLHIVLSDVRESMERSGGGKR